MVRRRKILANLIVLLIILACILSAVKLFDDFSEEYYMNKYSSELSKSVKKETLDNGKRNIDFNKLWKINPNIVAWIEIPGTPVDYPIVCGEDNSFYLTHNIEGEYSSYGSIFVDYRIKDMLLQSKNIIIFGHNMGRYSDLMFSSLMKYENKDYFGKHKEVIMYFPEKTILYNIFSVREVQDDSYAYDISFNKSNTFKNWIKESNSDSMYEIEQEKEQVKNVLTLSTCTYGSNKLVIVCTPKK